jgi:hypothetical protein
LGIRNNEKGISDQEFGTEDLGLDYSNYDFTNT